MGIQNDQELYSHLPGAFEFEDKFFRSIAGNAFSVTAFVTILIAVFAALTEDEVSALCKEALDRQLA